MKKFIKNIATLSLVLFVLFAFVACGSGMGAKANSGEKVELTKALIGDVEFENSKETKLKKEDDKYVISGTIDAMSTSQKIAFGNEDVTHVVALKFTFDRERTISKFEIKGEKIKVYSDDKNVENYVGSISDLLDSEEGEDAFCFLVLSAKTETYKLKSTYSDGTEKTIELDIIATLATAIPEK